MFRTLIDPSSGTCDYSIPCCRLQPEACNTDTTPTQPHRNSNTHWTKNNTTNAVIQQNSRKLLMMDILMSETYWAYKKWNKIASDIKLVFYSSNSTVMHGPIIIRVNSVSVFALTIRCWTWCTASASNSSHMTCLSYPYVHECTDGTINAKVLPPGQHLEFKLQHHWRVNFVSVGLVAELSPDNAETWRNKYFPTFLLCFNLTVTLQLWMFKKTQSFSVKLQNNGAIFPSPNISK